ncbi:MAG TPA: glutamate--tRNA ligase, partial [Clostridia bacterium]
VGGSYGPYIQSERKDIYNYYAHKLVETGAAYYCFCSKERLAKLQESGAAKYDKYCLHNVSLEEAKARIATGEPFVVRQNIPESGVSTYTDLVFGEISVDCKDLDDNILLKSDGMPTYNFANVIDDHLMNITHVIRGVEYLSSTNKYNLIYDAFGWQRPQYIHLQPIMKDSAHKLSKRTGDASFEDFIKKGYLSQAIVNYIALLGWSPKDNREKLSMQDLVEAFSIEGLSKSPSIFDENKMRWLNSLYMKELPKEEFAKLSKPYYDALGLAGKYDYELLDKLLQSRLEILSEIPEKLKFLDEFDNFDLSLFENKKLKIDQSTAKEVLPKLLKRLEEIPSFENAVLFENLKQFAQEINIKSAALFWIMRIALTGAEVTPGGATEMAELFGKERSLERIKTAYNRLG